MYATQALDRGRHFTVCRPQIAFRAEDQIDQIRVPRMNSRKIGMSVTLWVGLIVPSANLFAQGNISSSSRQATSARTSVSLGDPVAFDDPKVSTATKTNSQLSLKELIRAVLDRNQTLAQMNASWAAAAARYPQMTSPDDPVFASMISPNSFSSNTVKPGYRVEVSQKILWPGKRKLRGDMASAEASAASDDVEDMRLQLVEMARNAYFDYFLVFRATQVNNDALRLLQDIKSNAETRFRTGQAPQQDILQATVELNKQRERGITLERMRRVASARLNTLMHQEPDAPLPPPLEKMPKSDPLPPLSHLLAQAINARPDLRALESRINADRAALALATKEYWPDIEIAGAYDTIMGNGPMRDLAPQVGVRMNLPVRINKRNAAIAEAQAKIAQRSAELAAKIDQVKFQVQEAYEQYNESQQIAKLYESSILPDAEENVRAAQNAYVTGKSPFVSLIEAQRNLIMLRDRSYEVSADSFRRMAILDRLVGKMP
jgi:cobalt-zinc-cadmium efflux system outer membrane protein